MCEMRHFALRNVAFYSMKHATLQAKYTDFRHKSAVLCMILVCN